MGRIIRKKVIMVSPDSRDKLAEAFNTTKTTVLRSLNYSSNSAPGKRSAMAEKRAFTSAVLK